MINQQLFTKQYNKIKINKKNNKIQVKKKIKTFKKINYFFNNIKQSWKIFKKTKKMIYMKQNNFWKKKIEIQ